MLVAQVLGRVSFSKINQDSFEIWLILGSEQEVYKMSLGHLVMSASKEMLKKTSH